MQRAIAQCNHAVEGRNAAAADFPKVYQIYSALYADPLPTEQVTRNLSTGDWAW